MSARAEVVCRHYLPKGRREGRYWMVGDIDGTPGRSLYVRLKADTATPGQPGKWTDAATGEHGDLIDLIRINRHLPTLTEALTEARDFLALPAPLPEAPNRRTTKRASPSVAARRLFDLSSPICGTLAETYFRVRGITADLHLAALRFHPACYHWVGDGLPLQRWPALIAAITDNDAALTGVHRTWLARDASDKAPLDTQRRAMGAVLSNAIRFGLAEDVMIAGEGIETMLSLRSALPCMPMAACTSANHLAGFTLPSLNRLYIARDNDVAGQRAYDTLSARASAQGITVSPLDPLTNDFNDDLAGHGLAALVQGLNGQLDPDHWQRFLQIV